MDQRIALFIDHENIEIGTQEVLHQAFDPQRVLNYLNEDGQVWVAISYADWARYARSRLSYAESGFKLIDRPRRAGRDKNGTDIQLAVDATDLCHRQPEINTFVLVTGDSDYLPVVRLLREYGKSVIIIANVAAASAVLVRNCTQFLAYEALVSKQERGPGEADLEFNKKLERSATDVLRRLLEVRRREANEGGLRVSSLKDLIANEIKTFDEKRLGYQNFSAFLDAHVGEWGFRRTHRSDGQPVLVLLTTPTSPVAKPAPAPAAPRPAPPAQPPRPRRSTRGTAAASPAAAHAAVSATAPPLKSATPRAPRRRGSTRTLPPTRSQ